MLHSSLMQTALMQCASPAPRGTKHSTYVCRSVSMNEPNSKGILYQHCTEPFCIINMQFDCLPSINYWGIENCWAEAWQPQSFLAPLEERTWPTDYRQLWSSKLHDWTSTLHNPFWAFQTQGCLAPYHMLRNNQAVYWVNLWGLAKAGTPPGERREADSRCSWLPEQPLK